MKRNSENLCLRIAQSCSSIAVRPSSLSRGPSVDFRVASGPLAAHSAQPALFEPRSNTPIGPIVSSGTISTMRFARILGQAAYIVICAVAVPITVFAASSGSQYSPTFSPGFLIAWLVCNGRKRNPIGGWLFFFYWQLYSGLLMSSVFFAMNIESYVPENFAGTGQFALFLASAVPGLLLFVLKCAVGTMLLSARTWDMLKLLRWVMVAELAADLLGTGIDAVYFPDNLALSFLTIVPNLLWLAYIFRSTRVQHVFRSHDWDVAVNSIYPLKLKIAT